MIVLDASVWISLLLEDEANHATSLSWIQTQQGQLEVFAVPTLFLVEVGAGMARRSRLPDDARRAIADIRRDPAFSIFPLDDRLAAAAADLAIDLHLRGADAVYVALAEHLGVPLITWDAQQAARSSQVITAITPDSM